MPWWERISSFSRTGRYSVKGKRFSFDGTFLKPKKNSKRSPRITRWLMFSFSRSRNLRKVSISSRSLPVKWASETKIQSFPEWVNRNSLPPHAAIIETQSLHLIRVIDISEIDENGRF